MKKIAFIAALAASTFAVPSYAATEGYIDARVGYAWAVGESETIGLAAGYDFDVSSTVFLGAEAVATTNSSFGSPIIGANTRLGIRTSDTDKVFATVGYAYDTYDETDDSVLGAGYEHKFGKTAVNLQYQRGLSSEINIVFVGLGFKF
jgi:hypothetical protein